MRVAVGIEPDEADAGTGTRVAKRRQDHGVDRALATQDQQSGARRYSNKVGDARTDPREHGDDLAAVLGPSVGVHAVSGLDRHVAGVANIHAGHRLV